MMRRDLVLSVEQQLLKVASRDLVRAFGGTDAAGAALGKRQQAISDCTLPNTDRFLSIDDVARLEAVTVGYPGHPHVTAALAMRAGKLLVDLPQVDGDVAAALPIAAAEHAAEAADVTTRMMKLIGSEPLTPETVRRHELVREAREAATAALRLLALVEAIAGGRA